MRQLEILIAVSLVSAACSLLGPFLILRKMSMMIDSITHTILLGIVIAFFITKDLTSPLLIVGAGLVGILTVFLTELINQKTTLHEDASIGLVFPFLFSIAIILISKFLRGVHLCIDSVLVDEPLFLIEDVPTGEVDFDLKLRVQADDSLLHDIPHLTEGKRRTNPQTFRTGQETLQMGRQHQRPLLVGPDRLEDPDAPLDNQVADGQSRLRRRDETPVDMTQFHVANALQSELMGGRSERPPFNIVTTGPPCQEESASNCLSIKFPLNRLHRSGGLASSFR